MVQFKPFAPDKEKAILDRATKMGEGRLTLAMDLAAVNAICPLDPDKLLAFPEFDFLHDIMGIQAHLNRETGELEDFFLPRCAVQ